MMILIITTSYPLSSYEKVILKAVVELKEFLLWVGLLKFPFIAKPNLEGVTGTHFKKW